MFYRTHNSERRFASDSNVTDDTVQVERKRELARRRFDIAEQRRAQRATLNKKRASMLKGDGGVKMGVLNRICSKKRKKVEEGSPPPRKMWYRRSS
ncbi:hypothetical protein TELCIR_11933 [Teladorsagia circumcincta]|uniref:IBB domain-containing protein n=1 Tax=Teladorsagia circumcincta TaxID=45464 RepID=A0A2G9U851_TELCI|nr:hypothetical protein TELCIR_11933 [Teladorsagia circumcincta]